MSNQIYVFSLRLSDAELKTTLDAIPKGEFSDWMRKAAMLYVSVGHPTVADELASMRRVLAEIKNMLERGAMVATPAQEPGQDVLDAIKQKLDGVGI